MTTSARICVVGSVNVDLTFRTTRLPRPGETLVGQAFQREFGGKGANQAVMAARLGAQVALVARVGDDVFGRDSLRHLRECGLDTTYLKLDAERSTGVAGIVVDQQARNCILVIPGANFGLSPGDVRAAAPALAAASVVLCQLEVPLETTLEALRVAKAAGARTILNPAPATPLPREFLPLADVCIPNETEIETLTGKRAETIEEVAAAALELRGHGGQSIIVTLGGRGALILENDEMVHIPVVPVAAVDPTGAGDAFIGSLAVFWSEGHNLLEAARMANAVAALTVTRQGTQSAFPTRAQAETFLKTCSVLPNSPHPKQS
jgi:ribokinase